MHSSLPDPVQYLVDSVSQALGRPAHCRQVRNRDEWYVCDPVISFIQQGMKRGNTGYRVGYRYDGDDNSFWFIVVHSPIMAKLFKRNLVLSSLVDVLRSTAKYRCSHRICRSSKQAIQSANKRDYECIESKSMSDFIEKLEMFDEEFGFVEDLFPARANTGKGGGKAPVAGNTFYVKLADRSQIYRSRVAIERLVDLTWPLFLCLYPIKPIEGRTAGLARKMRARGIEKVCEISSIQSLPESISRLCRGAIQGAHIKPDALGGSDQPENGLWLCEYHHRTTEGKLRGTRRADGPDVRFVATS